MKGSKGQVASADALRVFISSRIEELAAERSAIRSALSKTGCSPWMFEVDAGARPGSVRNTYLETLNTCDVYLGLFWKTRGNYTVDEFDAARRAGLACLIYEKDATERQPELASFLEEIGHVEEGVTIRRFRTAEELGELAVADIEAVQRELLRVRGPSGRTYTGSPCGGRFDRTARETPIRRHPLHQTDGPSPPDPFVDRSDPVARLQQALAGGEQLLGVSGQPGIGKSALLRYLAHHPGVGIEQHPDGVGIYIEGGRWPQSGDLLRAVWAELFRVAERSYVPDDVELRTDLGSKKALVFVDELRLSAGQVERVHADMPESTLVMAARAEAGSLDYARSIPLRGFVDPDDIIELFAACCGSTLPDDTATEVVELCRAAGATPGAITRLACDAWGSGLPLSEWLASRVGPDPVTAILERTLDEEGRRLLAILASFGPDTATPAEVAARLGVSDRDVKELVAAGHASENSPDLRLAGADYSAIRSIVDVEGFRSLVFDAAIEWVGEAESHRIRQARPFLLEMLEWGVEQSRQTEVVRLARALAPHLAVVGAWDSWGAVVTHALAASRALGDRSAQAWALHEQGTRQMMLGNDRDARRLLRSAQKMRRGLGDREGAAVTTHNLSHLRAFPVAGRMVWMAVSAVVLTLAVVIGVLAGTGTRELGPPDDRTVVTVPRPEPSAGPTAPTTLPRPDPPTTPPPVAPPPSNEPPVAVDDEFEVAQGGTVHLDLLRNDFDPDDHWFGIRWVNDPSFGGVRQDDTGEWYYENWESGADTDFFDYAIEDEAGATSVATVTIHIVGEGAVNRPPVAHDDFFEVGLDDIVPLDLLDNDYDPDGDEFWVQSVEHPVNGSVYEENGQWYYDSWQYSTETEIFSYIIEDWWGDTARATVTITIIPPPAPPNLAPQAESAKVTVGCGTSEITLSGFDPEGGGLSFQIVEWPTRGVVTDPEQLSPSASRVWYEPTVGEGTYWDGFAFEVFDGVARDVAVITIEIVCIG